MNLEAVNYLCMGCMCMRNQVNGFCTKCGYNENVSKAPSHQLPVRTILDGRYLVGRVLGEGGFGITYIAWDLVSEKKVAIKEYYPSGFVTRNSTKTNSVTMYDGDKKKFFIKGKNRFIEEANRLVTFNSAPGIVSIYNCVIENGTTYIVMEYVDGFTLKSYLKKMGGKIPAEQIFDMMKPLMSSLVEIHKAGIIHRDISPDNIMITNTGYIKLIDFGAAKDFAGNADKTMSIRIKPGYSPEEQYRSKGVQGPWTDVYALCATIYRAVTGQTPPVSPERLLNDKLITPAQMGIYIVPNKESALLRGLAVLQKDRFKNIAELFKALYPNEQLQPVRQQRIEQQPAQQPPIQPLVQQLQPQPQIQQQQIQQQQIQQQQIQPPIQIQSQNRSGLSGAIIVIIIVIIIIILAVIAQM